VENLLDFILRESQNCRIGTLKKNSNLTIRSKKSVFKVTMNSAPMVGTNSPTSATDRRRHTRYRLAVPISVHVADGAVIPAITLEISNGGLSAVLAAPLKLGDIVQLENFAPGTVLAHVCRQLGKVYGFEFLHLTDDQANKIREDCRRLPFYPSNHTGI
jgi:hypothetical protein